MSYPREWEKLSAQTWRLKVPGGFLLRHSIFSSYGGYETSMKFLSCGPDDWPLEEEPDEPDERE